MKHVTFVHPGALHEAVRRRQGSVNNYSMAGKNVEDLRLAGADLGSDVFRDELHSVFKLDGGPDLLPINDGKALCLRSDMY